MGSHRLSATLLVTGALAGLAGCAQGSGDNEAKPATPDYRGGVVTLMGGDMVLVQVKMGGRATDAQLADYSRCVATGYTVANHAGFVRHVSTKTAKQGGIWQADTVYSITSALPEGLQTIDAAVTVEDCAARGIPTGG